MKSSIPVYAAEISAGLSQAVASCNSIAYVSPLLKSPEKLREQLVTAQVKEQVRVAIGGEVSFDLYPTYSILVTTGWNNNTDIFLREETWAARSTPEDKPFNFAHEPRQIIGHITDNTVVDDNLIVIAEDIPFEEVPDKFHILTSSVIYRHINSRDDTLEAEAAELIESIQRGDWFVSMECLFGGFDYGISYASGEQQIIPRNQSTAFLTKHLRMHRGCGEYNGGKLGRVLRNITFSGKGLVENPANKESVIFNNTERFTGVFASVAGLKQPDNQEHGDSDMADNNEKYVAQIEEQNKALQSDLAAANQRIEELGEAQVKSALAEKDAEISKLQDDLKSTQAKIDELTASFNEATKARDEAFEAKSEIEKQLAEATDKLGELETKSRTTARVALMVDKGVEKAEAESVVADFVDLDDDKFNKVVEMTSKAAQAKCSTDDEDKKDKKDKAAKADDNTEDADPDGEGAAAAFDMDSAEPDKDAVLGSDTDPESERDELMQSLASFLDTAMHGKSSDE